MIRSGAVGMTWTVALLVVASACGGDATPTGGGTTVEARGSGSGSPPWLADERDPTVARMRDIARRLAESGMGHGPIGGRGFITARHHENRSIHLPRGRCLTIVALGSRGIEDLDVTLFSPEGDVLAEDVEPDAHPSVQVCGGPRGRRLYYSLHADAGSGAFVFASFVGERASFEAATRVLGGRPGVVAAPGAQGGGDGRIAEISAGLARRGFRTHGEPAVFHLARDQRVRVPLPVERSHCYSVAAISGPGIGGLEVRVLDELGAPVAQSAEPSGVIQLCVDRDGDLSVDVSAARGEGTVRVVFFGTTVERAGGRNSLWLGERSEEVRRERPLTESLGALSVRLRASGWGQARRRARGTLGPGEARAEEIGLQAGVCSRLFVVGGRGMGAIALRLVDMEGRLLGERQGQGGEVAVTVCPEGALRVVAQMVSRHGSGAWALMQSTRAAPPWLGSEVPWDDRGPLMDAVDSAAGPALEPVARAAPIERVALAQDAETALDLPDADGCLAVRLVASGRDRTLQASVSRDGRVEALRSGRRVDLVVCGRGPERPEVQVKGVGQTRAAWLAVLAPPRE